MTFARLRIRGSTREDLAAAGALGVCSSLLTLAFFEAISRIPLGVAVTIEFLAPSASRWPARAARATSAGSCWPARGSRC